MPETPETPVIMGSMNATPGRAQAGGVREGGVVLTPIGSRPNRTPRLTVLLLLAAVLLAVGGSSWPAVLGQSTPGPTEPSKPTVRTLEGLKLPPDAVIVV